MITKKELEKFDKAGYFKIRVLPKKITNQFYDEFAKSIRLIIEREFPNLDSNININSKEWLVNKGMLFLDKKNHKFLVEIYDQIPRTNIFYNIINYEKIIKIVNCLLKRNSQNNLYINPATLRMDIPKKFEYSYGWHRDNNSNIPNSNFIQLWCPLINDINKKIGGLNVLNGSHKYNLNTSSTKIEKNKLKKGMVVRPSLKTKVFKSKDFKEEIITAKVGEIVFFNNSLMHKSGLNFSNEKIRYVLAAFYHDTTNKEWNFFYQNHKS
ncbi:MAG: hypothetical protein CFH18_00089 [Alphaproteobacteria bacterium MarineAlpha5_Bin8]|nr:MAG: hypothetical protein CFH18_00089 [Alphaproteobacteria bacterium MarineAlpha5_Bin8]PPR54539.1 MAG: hypothetical protein CFH16_00327 [Alphaproteobacteria bacterium MarineAlpha5_Bin6]|tara:strand:- start:3641 stop:4441 length:801 start_codon:yes stop_codon:yes gene_type:complete